ncbi:MAG: hypothetical protein LBP58_00380 [Azoarcus sp.]|jgi:hypothetical protein|nr:hypothetical protein [Azoarcus sp.]
MITEFRKRQIITSSLRGAQRRGNPGGGAALPNAGAIRKTVWIAAGLKALAMTENVPRRECQHLSQKCSRERQKVKPCFLPEYQQKTTGKASGFLKVKTTKTHEAGEGFSLGFMGSKAGFACLRTPKYPRPKVGFYFGTNTRHA